MFGGWHLLNFVVFVVPCVQQCGANPRQGMSAIESKLDQLPAEKKAEIMADIQQCYETRPRLAMVRIFGQNCNSCLLSDRTLC